MRVFVGMTGASGHAYARRLIEGVVASGVGVDLCVTSAGRKVLRHELGVARPSELTSWLPEATAESVRWFEPDQVEAPASSGTSGTAGVVLCPCSMGTLARVAVGFSSNLVERAADVAIKEGKPLVVVPRETPLSQVHLENLLRLARLGACVLPAAPGFYHHPETIADLVDHVVGKVLDRLRVEHSIGARWQGPGTNLSEPPPEPGLEGAGRPPEFGAEP